MEKNDPDSRLHRSILCASRAQGGGTGGTRHWKILLGCTLMYPRLMGSPCYPQSVEITMLWVSPTHPNAWLWNSTVIQLNKDLLASTPLAFSVWRLTKDKSHLTAQRPLLSSFLFTPEAPDSITVSMTATRWAHNLLCFEHIARLISRTLYSFEVLSERYHLPKSLFYGYLQRPHLALPITKYHTFNSFTAFESLCKSGSLEKGLVRFLNC